jgi:hypothetical protein
VVRGRLLHHLHGLHALVGVARLLRFSVKNKNRAPHGLLQGLDHCWAVRLAVPTPLVSGPSLLRSDVERGGL